MNLTCKSCGTAVSGALVNQGKVWCQQCSARWGTTREYAHAAFGLGELVEPEPAVFALVWITESNGQRHTALVPADAAPNVERAKV